MNVPKSDNPFSNLVLDEEEQALETAFEEWEKFEKKKERNQAARLIALLGLLVAFLYLFVDHWFLWLVVPEMALGWWLGVRTAK